MNPLRLLLFLGRRELTEALGGERAQKLRETAPGRFTELIPAIPDLGRPAARTFLLATAMMVAFHRALPERSVEDNAALFIHLTRRLLARLPRPIRALYRWVFFQPWYYRRLVAGIVGTSTPSTEGFIGALVLDDGPRAFGVDYQECGIQKLLRKLGCPELGPHVCELDVVESEVFGLGLARTGTIGRGAAACDFRWIRPGAPLTGRSTLSR